MKPTSGMDKSRSSCCFILMILLQYNNSTTLLTVQCIFSLPLHINSQRYTARTPPVSKPPLSIPYFKLLRSLHERTLYSKIHNFCTVLSVAVLCFVAALDPLSRKRDQ